MTTDSYIRVQHLKLIGPDFRFLSQFLYHVTLTSALSRSRPSVPYGANLFMFSDCCNAPMPMSMFVIGALAMHIWWWWYDPKDLLHRSWWLIHLTGLLTRAESTRNRQRPVHWHFVTSASADALTSQNWITEVILCGTDRSAFMPVSRVNNGKTIGLYIVRKKGTRRNEICGPQKVPASNEGPVKCLHFLIPHNTPILGPQPAQLSKGREERGKWEGTPKCWFTPHVRNPEK